MAKKKSGLPDGLYRICHVCNTMFPIKDEDSREGLCFDCYKRIQSSGHYLADHVTKPSPLPIFPCEDLWGNIITGPGDAPIIKKAKPVDRQTKPAVKQKFHRFCKKCQKGFMTTSHHKTLCPSCSKIAKQGYYRKARDKKKGWEVSL
jgi:hypothetical protein